ncbi:MAG: PP2C family serine/threonine-protein phosphatase [Lentimicrobium sp.]
MIIEIFTPGTIFCKGRRENMEDYIFPVQGAASENDTLFIVCDGMGGHARGEVASRLACETFAGYLTPHLSDEITERLLTDALDSVQNTFDQFISGNPETKGMGTTVVLAILHQNGVAILHCGDSRLCHFRESELIWKTTDHTLVNEWLRQGLVTKNEAEHHPKSNVITRAIQGKNVHDIQPDLHFISDLRADDYLLLCSDGIYSGVTDDQLTEILASNETDAAKLNHIKSLCEGNSRDNYSAYLIKVRNIL